jgi:hypothetical protein
MKTYPYHTPEGIIELVDKRELDQLLERLDKSEELIREIRDDEVNPQDEADKFLRDHQPSELAKMRADNAELLDRLSEARESHLAASARDVQTIQRQSVEICKLQALAESRKIDFVSLAKALLETRDIQVFGDGCSNQDRDVWILAKMISDLLPAYESANLEPVNTIDDAVRRMEEIDITDLYLAWDSNPSPRLEDGIEGIRARLIQAAKGEQL